MSCNFIEFVGIFYNDFLFPVFQQLFPVFPFSSLPRRSNISIRKTLERIRKSYWFSKNDLKHEINFGEEFASEGVKAAYIARTIFLIYSYLKSCVWLLLVAVTLPVTSTSCEKNF